MFDVAKCDADADNFRAATKLSTFQAVGRPRRFAVEDLYSSSISNTQFSSIKQREAPNRAATAESREGKYTLCGQWNCPVRRGTFTRENGRPSAELRRLL